MGTTSAHTTHPEVCMGEITSNPNRASADMHTTHAQSADTAHCQTAKHSRSMARRTAGGHPIKHANPSNVTSAPTTQQHSSRSQPRVSGKGARRTRRRRGRWRAGSQPLASGRRGRAGARRRQPQPAASASHRVAGAPGPAWELARGAPGDAGWSTPKKLMSYYRARG